MAVSGVGKPELRQQAKAVRDAVPPADRRAWSLAIADHGLATLRSRAAGAVVSLYWPMRSEADPRPLATEIAAAGAQLALPAFVGARMEFRRWQPGDELRAAGFQTFEPSADAPVVLPTIVLAPLLAFDRRGGRLGWGKGYYDTYLGTRTAAGTRPLVIGVAFACQEVAAVPMEPHDHRLDGVVTEHGFRPSDPTG